MSCSNYATLEEIGSGSFGKIFKVRRISDSKIFAKKDILYSKMSDKEKLQLVSEVNIMRELHHPNIVRYYERIVDKENCLISIIMEYCDGGDLSSVIRLHKREKYIFMLMRRKCIDESLIWKLFTQILSGLHECHNFKHGVVLHRDLKPENIFLDAQMNAKIGDFGLSRVLERQVDFAKTFVGTPYYMSPEQVTETTYDVKSDMWSLGCLLYEMCSLSPPFDASNQQQLSAKIMQGYYYRIPSIYSDNLVKPTKRPTTSDLLNFHPIKLQITEFNLVHQAYALGKKEQDLLKKEKLLSQRAKEIEERYEALDYKERELDRLERYLELKQKELMEFEKKLKLHGASKIHQGDEFPQTPTSARSLEQSLSMQSPLDRLTERMARHVSLISAKKSNLSVVKSR